MNVENIKLEAISDNKIQKMVITYANGKKVTKKLNRFSSDEAYNKFKAEVSKVLVDNGMTQADKNSKWEIVKYTKTPIDVIKEKLEVKGINVNIPEYTVNDFNTRKVALTGFTTGLAATALVTSLYGCGPLMSSKDDEVTITEEAGLEDEQNISLEVEEDLTLEGKDWAYYAENFPAGVQKASKESVYDFAMNFNRSEDWMYSKLTPEMIEALEKAGYVVDGDEAIFGFTAEQLDALNIVYGNHTKEGLLQIMNGDQIDVEKMAGSAESTVNQAKRVIMIWYMTSDHEHLNIDQVVNFNEDQMTTINKFETILYEAKMLMKQEGKEKEAEAKMKELKEAIVDYAHAQTLGEDEVKNYVLTTILPAASFMSTSYQYKDTVKLQLQNSKTGEAEIKEVKTDLFDEITMRELVEGFRGCHGINDFNEVEFLKQFGINSNSYHVAISDAATSIADSLISGVTTSKLNTYNSYVSDLRTEEAAANAAYTADSVIDINDNSEFDRLTKGGYDNDVILALIDSELHYENKYPKNLGYFLSSESKFIKELNAYRTAHGIGVNLNTSAKGGVTSRYIPVSTTTTTRIISQTTERHNVEEDNPDYQQQYDEMQQQLTHEAEVSGGHNQEIYDAIYGGASQEEIDHLIHTYGDELTPVTVQVATEDHEQAEQVQTQLESMIEGSHSHTGEGQTLHVQTGGEVHIDPQFQGADTVSEEEALAYQIQHGTTATETTTPEETTTVPEGEYIEELPPGFHPVVEDNANEVVSFDNDADFDAYFASLEQQAEEESVKTR